MMAQIHRNAELSGVDRWAEFGSSPAGCGFVSLPGDLGPGYFRGDDGPLFTMSVLPSLCDLNGVGNHVRQWQCGTVAVPF